VDIDGDGNRDAFVGIAAGDNDVMAALRNERKARHSVADGRSDAPLR